MDGNELPTVRGHASQATTSSYGTSARGTRPRSARSHDKPASPAQRKAGAELAKRARRTIANALELAVPAVDDMPLTEGLKACCEIVRRFSAKAATLAARVNDEQPLPLLDLTDLEDVG